MWAECAKFQLIGFVVYTSVAGCLLMCVLIARIKCLKEK